MHGAGFDADGLGGLAGAAAAAVTLEPAAGTTQATQEQPFAETQEGEMAQGGLADGQHAFMEWEGEEEGLWEGGEATQPEETGLVTVKRSLARWSFCPKKGRSVS